MSREAEGQQGLESAVQVTSVRQNSLDIFSPAHDGQLMPSQINTFSSDFLQKPGVWFLLQTLGPQGQLEIQCLEEHRVKNKPLFVLKSPSVLALMLCFCSSQFGDAVQRM